MAFSLGLYRGHGVCAGRGFTLFAEDTRRPTAERLAIIGNRKASIFRKTMLCDTAPHHLGRGSCNHVGGNIKTSALEALHEFRDNLAHMVIELDAQDAVGI